MIKPRIVNVMARIPYDLKRKVSDYCLRKGIKLQFFIAEALEEKLTSIEEDAYDADLMDRRLKNPQLTTMDDLKNYLNQRTKKK